MIHASLSPTRARPAMAAAAKLSIAAALTFDGAARRWPTRRTGPTRASSVPRMPSE
jgi:hypothetical protein